MGVNFLLREMPEWDRMALKVLAAQRSTTMNKLLLQALHEFLKRETPWGKDKEDENGE